MALLEVYDDVMQNTTDLLSIIISNITAMEYIMVS